MGREEDSPSPFKHVQRKKVSKVVSSWLGGSVEEENCRAFFCLKVDEGRVSRECECVCACIIMYEDEKERGKKKKSHLARTLNSYCACKEQEKGFKV